MNAKKKKKKMVFSEFEVKIYLSTYLFIYLLKISI